MFKHYCPNVDKVTSRKPSTGKVLQRKLFLSI